MEHLEIRTGFEEITFDHLKLRDHQIDLVKKLLSDGHIINVREIRKRGADTEICGHCTLP